MTRLITILLLALYGNIQAQQLPLFTQYRDNYAIFNPAMVSPDYHLYDHNLSVGASYRSQWTDIDNSPTTQVLQGEFLYDNGGSFSLLTGGHLMNDRTGPTGFTGIYGRLGAVFTEDPYYGGFSVGLNIGAVQYRVDTDKIRLRDANDIVVDGQQTQIYPDVGLGVYYYKQMSSGILDGDYIFGGLSVPQALGLNLEYEDEFGKYGTKRLQHFYGFAGIYHFFRNESFLETTTWVKYVKNAPVNVDINLRYQLANSLSIGAGLSSAKTTHVEVGFTMGENLGLDNNIRMGYGFDYTFSTFGPFAGGAHEIHVIYSIER